MMVLLVSSSLLRMGARGVGWKVDLEKRGEFPTNESRADCIALSIAERPTTMFSTRCPTPPGRTTCTMRAWAHSAVR
eukprot:scaffold87757_cov57-Phaeocystis_antarctica.AAC.1